MTKWTFSPKGPKPVIVFLFLVMNTTLDSELVNATTHSCQVYDDAYNNNDPQALAKLFTEDATLVTDTGILHGLDAILKYQTEAFKIIKFSNHKGDTRSRFHSSDRDRWKRVFCCGNLEPGHANARRRAVRHERILVGHYSKRWHRARCDADLECYPC